jgi:hypothetical protein
MLGGGTLLYRAVGKVGRHHFAGINSNRAVLLLFSAHLLPLRFFPLFPLLPFLIT